MERVARAQLPGFRSREPLHALLRDASAGQWLLFEHPLDVFETSDPAEILPLLRTIEQAASARGLYAVGVLAYEAAPAFDPVLTVRPAGDVFPLLWFGLFPSPIPVALEDAPGASADSSTDPAPGVAEHGQPRRILAQPRRLP